MRGKRFIIGNNSEIEISYYLSGKLKGIVFSEGIDVSWMNRTIDLIYKTENVEAMTEHMKSVTKVRVQEVPVDLSFERFYEEYGYKVGKKNATRAWNKLSRKQKVRALIAIPKYKAFCARKKTPMVYPATYLNDARYDDEILNQASFK